MAFELTSPAFKESGAIPKKHTCEGADVSPALRWTAPPAAQVLEACKRHILAEAQLMGRFGR